MSKFFSIYLITNVVNQKKYTGFTSDAKQRWIEHQFYSYDPAHPKHSYIHRAMHKYGLDNFTFEVIYQSLDGKHTLDEMEAYFIKEYDTFGPNGYNLTSGGEGNPGYKKTPEQIENHRRTLVGRKHTEEHKRKLSELQSGENHNMFGIPKPQTVKDKISATKTGCKWWNNGTESKTSHERPGEGWVRGRIKRSTDHTKMSESKIGCKWWNNGSETKSSKTCPGEGWVLGRKLRKQ
jgi:group I intron endonuclease